MTEGMLAALGSRFAEIQEYERAGFTNSYVGWQATCRRWVNIVVPNSPEFDQRMINAVSLAAPLYHPNILPILESGTVDGKPYFVTPHVDGRWLDGYLQRRGQLPFPEVVQLVATVADALAHCHDASVVHCDIKSHNVLRFDSHLAIHDFMIARPMETGLDALVDDGFAVGTPFAMSPEQLEAWPLDGRTDLFSLGVLGFQCLTGKLPFGDSMSDILQSIYTAVPGMPEGAREDERNFLEQVLSPMMAPNRDKRPASARAVLELVRPFLVNPGLPAPKEEPVEPYEGEDPYFFISYSQQDRRLVEPYLRHMTASGYNVWYDRGIPGGAEWDSLIESRIMGCSGVVMFLSPRAVDSKFVRREIKFADHLNKAIVTIALEAAELRHGLQMLLTQYQMLDISSAKPVDVARALHFVHQQRGTQEVKVTG